MPVSFTKEERDILRDKFYEKGYDLLKTFGYKKLKVSDIASTVGIGTGTFYNFFKSKDDFIIWLISKIKQKSLNQFLTLSENYEDGIPMKAMEQYLFDTISNYNIYRCLTQDDYDILQKKYGLLDDRKEKIVENGKFIMEKLATSKPFENFLLFSEAYTIIIIGTSDLNKLDSKYTDEVIKNLIHSACQFLY
ncbi:TetR/AcrR family transcriptional regulator [Microaceticoccus formicicus]|uniref:TetR/AcrR family transcriptional regulator n=1 Tax=Microaceticoccus formicicus TaxID=3118105 RepID=UPI003CD02824|nr:TetR/AcrR family transcriptional regulator [Peptoniphilaceae bacterium AMB_02]